jgi:hypothetical protein
VKVFPACSPERWGDNMKWYAYVIMILLWVVAVIVQISWSWWYMLGFLLALNLIEYLFFAIWYGKKTETNPWLKPGIFTGRAA